MMLAHCTHSCPTLKRLPSAQRRPCSSAQHSAAALRPLQAAAHSWHHQLGSQLAASGLTLALAMTLLPGSAAAAEQVGNFTASGFLFKDSVEVAAIEDPDVKGVTVYISDFKRSLSDKLNKNFFSEPSQASVTCATTGPVTVANRDRIRGSQGHEVFSESKGLNLFQNKTLRVKRLFDEKHDTLLYVAYSTRNSGASDDGSVSSGRYKTSVCALPISPSASQAAAVAEQKTGAPPSAAVK